MSLLHPRSSAQPQVWGQPPPLALHPPPQGRRWHLGVLKPLGAEGAGSQARKEVLGCPGCQVRA